MITYTGYQYNWTVTCLTCGASSRHTKLSWYEHSIKHTEECQHNEQNLEIKYARERAEKAVEDAWERNR